MFQFTENLSTIKSKIIYLVIFIILTVIFVYNLHKHITSYEVGFRHINKL